MKNNSYGSAIVLLPPFNVRRRCGFLSVQRAVPNNFYRSNTFIVRISLHKALFAKESVV